MSLFSVLNTSAQGLNASQMAMDVSGQNISNANTEGYSRKRVVQSATYRTDGTYGQIGMGVDVDSIERTRSQFIDSQIQGQNSENGVYDQCNTTMQGVENTFNEPSDTGLLSYINKFFDSWQNLANNPSDISARTVVQTTAQALTEKFNASATDLADQRQACNDQITDQVGKINELTQQISALNSEIGVAQITTGQNANDSLDKRDELVKQLASIINITVTENDRDQISINTGGAILVSPLDYRKLETTTGSYTAANGSQQPALGIEWADSKRSYTPDQGTLKGLFDSRDVIIPGYQAKLDTLATTLVQKVNALHSQGYSLSGETGFSFFNDNVTGAADISLSAAITSDVKNIAAASGGETQPAAANTSAAGTHNFGAAPLQLVRDPSVVPPVQARNIVAGSVIVTNGTTQLTQDVDYHIDPVNGTFQMLHAGYDAADLTINFQYRTDSFNGPGDNANALAIAQLGGQMTMTPDALNNPTTTFTDYYSSLVAQVGLDANTAQSNLDTGNFLVKQYQTQQDSIAGVSLDEEMSNMIQFQHTYQAAAHTITIADKMLDTLMSM
jgi:flagellar hook-associated protein 1 FlgK